MKKFKISSIHSVCINSFEEGELENVNNYDLSSIIEANSVKEAIQEYFNNYLNYYFVSGNAYVEDEFLYYDVLVDEDDVKVDDVEMKEEWKRGELVLYNNSVTLSVEELVSIDLEEVYQ